jgi:hypothetical protein
MPAGKDLAVLDMIGLLFLISHTDQLVLLSILFGCYSQATVGTSLYHRGTMCRNGLLTRP